MSARILVLPDGGLVRASDPYPGSMHDAAAPGASDCSTESTPPDGSPTRDTSARE